TGRHSGNFTMTFNRTMDGRPLTVETLGNYTYVYLSLRGHVLPGMASTHKASANVTINRITIDFGNNSPFPSNVARAAAAVGVGTVAAASVNIFYVLFGRLGEFFSEGIKEIGKEFVSIWEIRTRHIRARAKLPILFGVS